MLPQKWLRGILEESSVPNKVKVLLFLNSGRSLRVLVSIDTVAVITPNLPLDYPQQKNAAACCPIYYYQSD